MFSCLVEMFKKIFYRNISELSKPFIYQLPEKKNALVCFVAPAPSHNYAITQLLAQ